MKSFNEVLKITNKEIDYIVVFKSSKKVPYYGPDKEKAFRVYKEFKSKGKKVHITEPLKKHVITKDKLEKYDMAPSMYSGISL